MRDRAATENTSIPQIYAEEANTLVDSQSASGTFPVFRNVGSSLYRARRRLLPPLPQDRQDIVIPPSLQVSLQGEQFVLLYLPHNAAIVFGTFANFDTLCERSDIYMDGTFDSCPHLFQQLFIIHAFFGERQVPLLYVLMSSKDREAYISLFQNLKDLAVRRGRRFSPQQILSDFESGLILAIRDEFPQSLHRGCYFHFTHAIWWKVQQLGLSTVYTNNESIRGHIRQLMALGFLPVARVPEGLHTIIDSMPNASWHNKFNRKVDRHHPDIFRLIRALRSEQANVTRERLQIVGGQEIQRRNRRYDSLNRDLVSVKEHYDIGLLSELEYLTAVSYSLARNAA
ncbi:hypothetical protein R1sor_021998 [Riccia sorocarpa]|uniref:MULE transposase domain-containing protein n=1 Tax=Riccia sorocarpa TaxID=122646 RepID=A0ABD3GLL3_9MARC